MLKAIIFDLDRCILNTPAFYIKNFMDPVIEAIKKADVKNEISKEKLQIISRELWAFGLQGIIHWNDIPTHIAKVMKETFKEPIAQENITPFKDIKIIKELPQTKILVTKGLNIFQQSKIDNLKISEYFKECIIYKTDNWFKKITKQPIFEELLERYNWKPSEVMVIGDNPKDELEAGKELGMVTVQSLRPTVVKVEGFDYYVSSFEELPKIINKL